MNDEKMDQMRFIESWRRNVNEINNLFVLMQNVRNFMNSCINEKKWNVPLFLFDKLSKFSLTKAAAKIIITY